MSKRFFTADFHIGLKSILKFENRPFKTIEEMNEYLLKQCCSQAKIYVEEIDGKEVVVDKDTIIHVGDFASYNSDGDSNGLRINPQRLIANIPATFLNIRGNHDLSNKVKSVATMIRTKLGKKYRAVSISHYPSYDIRSKGMFEEGDVHICGHVHSAWKHCLDLTHKVLNINVGVDVWNYKLVSEHELITYIDKIMSLPKDKINKVGKMSETNLINV